MRLRELRAIGRRNVLSTLSIDAVIEAGFASKSILARSRNGTSPLLGILTSGAVSVVESPDRPSFPANGRVLLPRVAVPEKAPVPVTLILRIPSDEALAALPSTVWIVPMKVPDRFESYGEGLNTAIRRVGSAGARVSGLDDVSLPVESRFQWEKNHPEDGTARNSAGTFCGNQLARSAGFMVTVPPSAGLLVTDTGTEGRRLMFRKAGGEGFPVRSIARSATVDTPVGGSMTAEKLACLDASGVGVEHFCHGAPLMLISMETTA